MAYIYIYKKHKAMKLSIEQIANEIRSRINNDYTIYFTVENNEGELVKIRVSNHSGNEQNNSQKTLSFVNERTSQRRSAYNQMVNEWAILENGLTDTYQEIEYILENEL